MEDAEKCHLDQAKRLLELFENTHGHPAMTKDLAVALGNRRSAMTKDLAGWLGSRRRAKPHWRPTLRRTGQ